MLTLKLYQARIQHALETRENKLQETYIAWVKGHKDINSNEIADKISKQTSILVRESEGVITPAGLRAWARRVRAKARGGNGNGLFLLRSFITLLSPLFHLPLLPFPFLIKATSYD